jgi:RNA polymerase sigma-70 factor, ECF subfamily
MGDPSTKRETEAELQREVRARVPVQEVTDEILEKCINGNTLALRVFVKRYERLVFAYISRLLYDTGKRDYAHIVEDLSQTTFLRAFRALPNFKKQMDAKPSTWLLTIARRLYIDWSRSLEQQMLCGGKLVEISAVEEPSSPEATPECASANREMGREIMTAINKLPEAQRTVFLLAEVDEISHAEMVTQHGIPPNALRTRLSRARKKLRDMLQSIRRDN